MRFVALLAAHLLVFSTAVVIDEGVVSPPELIRDEPAKNEVVEVSVYFEALCPDSVSFVRSQMTPTYSKLKDYIKLDLIPFGKAKFVEDQATWAFQCQHGPRECQGNKMMACAVNMYPENEQIVPFIDCVMGSSDPPNAGERCAGNTGLDWSRIQPCASSNVGNEYLHDMGIRTLRLDPKLNFVPWININGEHSDDLQEESLFNLLKVVCNTYKGVKPPNCPS